MLVEAVLYRCISMPWSQRMVRFGSRTGDAVMDSFLFSRLVAECSDDSSWQAEPVPDCATSLTLYSGQAVSICDSIVPETADVV